MRALRAVLACALVAAAVGGAIFALERHRDTAPEAPPVQATRAATEAAPRSDLALETDSAPGPPSAAGDLAQPARLSVRIQGGDRSPVTVRVVPLSSATLEPGATLEIRAEPDDSFRAIDAEGRVVCILTAMTPRCLLEPGPVVLQRMEVAPGGFTPRYSNEAALVLSSGERRRLEPRR